MNLQQRITHATSQPVLGDDHLENRQDENAIYLEVTEASKALRSEAVEFAVQAMKLNEARERYEAALAKQAIHDGMRKKD